MEYMNKKKLGGMLLLIDFEKAFDSIEWDYIDRVLEAYNFGHQFQKWFKVLYKIQTVVLLTMGNFQNSLIWVEHADRAILLVRTYLF